MMKLFIKFFLLLIAISSAVYAADSKKTTGEDYLDNFLAKTRTLQADFKQTLRSSDGEILQKTAGVFYLSRPGKFRWDYSAPYAQKIISDGDHIWIYDVDLDQVTVKKQATGVPNTPMALLDNRLKLHQQFKVIPLDHSHGIYRLKLVSKTRDADFGEIIVGMDKHGLRFLQLHDQFNQVTDIVFDKLKTNTPLAASLFQFTPPPGVDVFGQF